MEEIVLYPIGCPSCMVLEKKLMNKKINFEKVSDSKELEKIGLTYFPVLKVGEKLMNFEKANDWVNKQEANQ